MRFHIAYENIDTVIEITPTHKPEKRYYRAKDGKKATHIRSIIFDAQYRPDQLLKINDLFDRLRKEDPEIDIETAGKRLTRTNRIIVSSDLKPIYTYKEWDVIIRPDGTRQERPHAALHPNADEDIPVKITDKLIDPIEIATKYVISRSFFLSHTDGVSYKFLYEIAKKLANAGKFARLQPYDPITKKPAPLVLQERAKPFPGVFLEGRIRGEEYCLILHLSAQELRVPERFISSEEGENS